MWEKIFHPESIAVVGATANPHSGGYGFTACLLQYGYKGKIYPVNPKRSEILGIKAFPGIADIPGPIDYVISCIPAHGVLDLVRSCSQKGIQTIHLYTARFSETGRQEGIALEREVLKEARNGGIRIIGPNCMGIYSPQHGISFSDAMPIKSGNLGLISQSGQFAEEFARFAGIRGVYLSKAISYGNAIDLNECDFLNYLVQDPETDVIAMYIEGVRGKEIFFRALSSACTVKPVVILKGGTGVSGSRAVASHTASLAGSQKIWDTLIAQTGAVSASTFEEMIDLSVSFTFLPPITGVRVGVAGGSGGTSVLAADECEAAGLDVIPLPEDLRRKLKANGSTIWDWIGNPVDMSIRDSADFIPGVMLEMMAEHKNFDLLMALMSDPHHERQKDMTAETYFENFSIEKCDHKPILAVVPDKSLGIEDVDHWSWKILCGLRSKLISAGLPSYPTVGRAAIAARKLVDYYRKRESTL